MIPLSAFGDDRQRVLDATDIVQLIGEHLALRPKGREYVGLCPFHDDHKPSMTVVPAKGIYKCFSCGAGGDAFGFVMDYHKMSFREALQYLAERANIKLTPRAPRRTSSSSGPDQIPFDEAPEHDPSLSRRALLDANQFAHEFFRVILNHPEHGRAARELIQRRAIAPEMVAHFGLGAAPDKWDGLAATIAARKINPAPFVAAGLFKRRDDGGLYDAFRNRLIFPITDQIGRVIAFGGRRLSDERRPDGTEDAKYLNSAESAAFDKSTTLYALHQAAPALRSTRTAIVVEGYMDAIACHQAGITNVVATLGTALTAGNARLLRRQCENVVLLFDGDQAGKKAAQRAVEIFFAEPIDVRIASLGAVTDAKDPDELLKRPGGRDLFESAIAKAVDPLALLLAGVRDELGGRGIAGQSRVAEEFLSRLAALGLSRVEPIRKQLIIRRLSEMTRIDADTLFAAMAAKPAPRTHPIPPSAGAADEDHAAFLAGRLTLGEKLLGCILCAPDLGYSLEDPRDPAITGTLRDDPSLTRVAHAAFSLLEAGRDPSLSAVLAALELPADQRVATSLAGEVDRLADRKPERIRQLWSEWFAQSLHEIAHRTAASDQRSAAARSDWDGALDRLTRLRDLTASVGTSRRSLPTTP